MSYDDYPKQQRYYRRFPLPLGTSGGGNYFNGGIDGYRFYVFPLNTSNIQRASGVIQPRDGDEANLQVQSARCSVFLVRDFLSVAAYLEEDVRVHVISLPQHQVPVIERVDSGTSCVFYYFIVEMKTKEQDEAFRHICKSLGSPLLYSGIFDAGKPKSETKKEEEDKDDEEDDEKGETKRPFKRQRRSRPPIDHKDYIRKDQVCSAVNDIFGLRLSDIGKGGDVAYCDYFRASILLSEADRANKKHVSHGISQVIKYDCDSRFWLTNEVSLHVVSEEKEVVVEHVTQEEHPSPDEEFMNTPLEQGGAGYMTEDEVLDSGQVFQGDEAVFDNTPLMEEEAGGENVIAEGEPDTEVTTTIETRETLFIPNTWVALGAYRCVSARSYFYEGGLTKCCIPENNGDVERDAMNIAMSGCVYLPDELPDFASTGNRYFDTSSASHGGSPAEGDQAPEEDGTPDETTHVNGVNMSMANRLADPSKFGSLWTKPKAVPQDEIIDRFSLHIKGQMSRVKDASGNMADKDSEKARAERHLQNTILKEIMHGGGAFPIVYGEILTAFNELKQSTTEQDAKRYMAYTSESLRRLNLAPGLANVVKTITMTLELLGSSSSHVEGCTVFFCMLTHLNPKDRANLIFHGTNATGKSWILKQIIRCMPKCCIMSVSSISERSLHAFGASAALKLIVSEETFSGLISSGNNRTSSITEIIKALLTLEWGMSIEHLRAALQKNGIMEAKMDHAHPMSIITCVNRLDAVDSTATDRFFLATCDNNPVKTNMQSRRSIVSKSAHSNKGLETKVKTQQIYYTHHFCYYYMIIEASTLCAYFSPVDLMIGHHMMQRVAAGLFDAAEKIRFNLNVQQIAAAMAKCRAIDMMNWVDGPFYELPEYQKMHAIDMLLFIDEEVMASALSMVANYTQDPLTSIILRNICDYAIRTPVVGDPKKGNDSGVDAHLLPGFGISPTTKYHTSHLEGKFSDIVTTGLKDKYGKDRAITALRLIKGMTVMDEGGAKVNLYMETKFTVSIHQSVIARVPSSSCIAYCKYLILVDNALKKLSYNGTGLPMAKYKVKRKMGQTSKVVREETFISIPDTAYFQIGVKYTTETTDDAGSVSQTLVSVPDAYVSCDLSNYIAPKMHVSEEYSFFSPGLRSDDDIRSGSGFDGKVTLFTDSDKVSPEFHMRKSDVPTAEMIRQAVRQLSMLENKDDSAIPVTLGDSNWGARALARDEFIFPASELSCSVGPEYKLVGKAYVVNNLTGTLHQNPNILQDKARKLNAKGTYDVMSIKDHLYINWSVVQQIASINPTGASSTNEIQDAVSEMCTDKTPELATLAPIPTNSKNPFPRVIRLRPKAESSNTNLQIDNPSFVTEDMFESISGNMGLSHTDMGDLTAKACDYGEDPIQNIQLKRIQRHGYPSIPKGWSFKECLETHKKNCSKTGGNPFKLNGEGWERNVAMMASESFSKHGSPVGDSHHPKAGNQDHSAENKKHPKSKADDYGEAGSA